MASFLLKTEPEDYGFADLVRDQRTVWNGVSNPLALKYLRQVKKGDTIVIYHTGKEKSAVGLAVAASAAYPDPKLDDAKRVVVELAPVKALKQPVALSTFKTDPVLCTVEMVRISRLSVMPLSPAQLARLLEHGAMSPP